MRRSSMRGRSKGRAKGLKADKDLCQAEQHIKYDSVQRLVV